jgi:hypothetical protein
MAKKAIIDMTDDKIDEELRSGVGHLIYLTNDFLAERDRRAARRQADSTQRIARIAFGSFHRLCFGGGHLGDRRGGLRIVRGVAFVPPERR